MPFLPRGVMATLRRLSQKAEEKRKDAPPPWLVELGEEPEPEDPLKDDPDRPRTPKPPRRVPEAEAPGDGPRVTSDAWGMRKRLDVGKAKDEVDWVIVVIKRSRR